MVNNQNDSFDNKPVINSSENMPNLNQDSYNRWDNNQMQTQNYQTNQQYSKQNQYNQGYNQQTNRPPHNQKSKIVGLILNMLIVGLGYAYVGKWGEGIVLFVVYLLMWFLGFFLIFPFVIAFALWVYSLVKTNEMIDKYNAGLPY